MSHQLAYVIVTPYSLYKSRTGGILARLISRTGLELVATRMFAPSPELVQQYSEVIISANDQMYIDEMKAWLKFLDTGDEGELCFYEHQRLLPAAPL